MPRNLASLVSTSLLLSGLSYAQTISNVSSSACPSQGGAHIIVARASLEAVGYGIIGAVKDQVLARVPGSTAEFVEYPATLADYINSESDGVLAMKILIDNFISNCSGSPLVLMGYSQGAQVTADSIAGQMDQAFPDNSTIDQPLSASTLARTAAAIMMGDPSLIANSSFHVGNSTKNGDFPRLNNANFANSGIASRMQSYCDFGDPYCAGGPFSDIGVHLGYVAEYGMAAEDFVVKQIAAYYANGGVASNSTSSTGSKNSTATPRVNGTTTATTRVSNGTYSTMSYSMPGMTTATTTAASGASSTSTPAVSTGAASAYGISAVGLTGALFGVVAWML